jgi:hypothetical protein
MKFGARNKGNSALHVAGIYRRVTVIGRCP